MINHTYIYNGIRYKRTKKDVAERKILADPKKRFFLVGNRVGDIHFHKGWCLATIPENLFTVRTHVQGILDDDILLRSEFNSFNFYLDPELGRYPVYYVQQA